MEKSYLYATISLTNLIVGGTLLAAGLVLFGLRLNFLFQTDSLEGVIVEVVHESVPAGRGSTPVYVPVVEVPNGIGETTRIKVDTSNQEPIYETGGTMHLLCDRSDRRYCVPNDFSAMWRLPLVILVIGIGLTYMGLYFKRHAQ